MENTVDRKFRERADKLRAGGIREGFNTGVTKSHLAAVRVSVVHCPGTVALGKPPIAQ